MSESAIAILFILVIVLSVLGVATLVAGYLWGLRRGYEIGRGSNQKQEPPPQYPVDDAGFKWGT